MSDPKFEITNFNFGDEIKDVRALVSAQLNNQSIDGKKLNV